MRNNSCYLLKTQNFIINYSGFCSEFVLVHYHQYLGNIMQSYLEECFGKILQRKGIKRWSTTCYCPKKWIKGRCHKEIKELWKRWSIQVAIVQQVKLQLKLRHRWNLFSLIPIWSCHSATLTHPPSHTHPPVKAYFSALALVISILEHIRYIKPDMEIGVDTGTLSAEIFDNCGNFWIVEDWFTLFLE